MRRLATVVTAAVLAVGAAAAPAHANEIGLSEDGVTWSDSLVEPIFEPDFVFVPGDVEVRSFKARNDGPSDGVLTVDVIASDPDDLLANDDFLVEAQVGSGPWVNVEPGSTRARTELKIAQGGQTDVRIRASFLSASTSQLESIPFSVRLTMSEDSDVGGVDEGDGDGNGGGDVGGVDDGGLPDTGSPIEMMYLWLAAGLIGAGLALVLPRRRRREEASCV
ncbi:MULTISPECIES: LPXTG cell wall anchor domain-containing protein [unclassified Nocardioides]|uniref:LPXTG cell wall anchor domain-containing protein n=1 Tax=unclassified Nocardioides TaxID=2615069 RepID=UPI0006FED453|nr:MULTISPECIES: LPXTG cell wall anchor domain-containing protein [unclassified Nocardioides]KRA32649.1 hypothetical protein ASD81_14075 [Nocardioides sp. Root614]